MSHNSGESFVGKNNNVEPRNIRWQDAALDVKELKTGDIVGGFENDLEVDCFITAIGDFLCDKRYRPDFDPKKDFTLNNQGRHIYSGWYGSSKPPSEVMRPSNFHGKLQNFELVMFQDVDKPSIDNLGHRTLQVGIFADMISTGRGVIGKVAKECTIGVILPSDHWENVVGHLITAKYKTIRNLHNAEKAAAELNLQADTIATLLIINGLKRIYSGGLPGLGKR